MRTPYELNNCHPYLIHEVLSGFVYIQAAANRPITCAFTRRTILFSDIVGNRYMEYLDSLICHT